MTPEGAQHYNFIKVLFYMKTKSRRSISDEKISLKK